MAFLFFPMNILERVRRFYFYLIFKICGVKFTIKGTENINKTASYIFISNHSSLLDIPAAKLSLPLNTKFIAKKELFKIPFFGFVIKRLGEIPIDRANKRKAIESLNLATERLTQGFSIWMAPEGTRNIDGNMRPFKKGAFMTALKANVHVVPLSLCGTWLTLPKKSLKVRPGRVDVTIHDPIAVNKEDIFLTMNEAHKIISEDIRLWKEIHE